MKNCSKMQFEKVTYFGCLNFQLVIFEKQNTATLYERSHTILFQRNYTLNDKTTQNIHYFYIDKYVSSFNYGTF